MSFTVTATQSASSAAGMELRVVVFDGAAPQASQNGATTTQTGAAAHQASITTTITGSYVVGSMIDIGTTTFTAASGTTLMDNTQRSGIQYGTCRTTSANGSPGAVTVGASAPADSGLLVLAEIIPSLNNSLTIDASGPAGVSSGTTAATTAAFTPPPGSLLVALVGSNGSSSVVNMNMSDTSGLGMTWTALVQNHPTAAGGTFAFMAQVPGLPAARVIYNIAVRRAAFY